jgi:hypothetical protein
MQSSSTVPPISNPLSASTFTPKFPIETNVPLFGDLDGIKHPSESITNKAVVVAQQNY